VWFVKDDHAREERIGREVPSDALERLRRMPEFVKAYEPEGMSPQEFIGYGVTQRTLSFFVEAGWKLMEDTSREGAERLTPSPGPAAWSGRSSTRAPRR